MRSARHDVIIIGAGEGGLAAASLLARTGMRCADLILSG